MLLMIKYEDGYAPFHKVIIRFEIFLLSKITKKNGLKMFRETGACS